MSEASTEATHFLLVSAAVMDSNSFCVRLGTVIGRVWIVFMGAINKGNSLEMTLSAVATEK